MSRSAARSLALAAVTLAFLLRIYNLGGLEFWFDEALSATQAAKDIPSILAYTSSASFEHTPGYYLVLAGWSRIAGFSEFALRFLSLWWGVLLVPLTYALLRRMAGRQLAALAALLTAVAPFPVAYAQEARMYSLVPLLALLLLYCLRRALDGRPWWWLAFLVVAGLGLATHYYFALLLIVTGGHLLLNRTRRQPSQVIGLALHVGLAGLGAAWLFLLPGPRDSVMRALEGETAYSLARNLQRMVTDLAVAEPRTGLNAIGMLAVVLTWILVLLGAVVWWRVVPPDRRAWGRLLLLWVTLPLAVSLVIPYGVLGRHLGYVLPAAFTFAAAALVWLRRIGKGALVAGVVAVLLVSGYGLWAQYTFTKGEFGEIMDTIADRARSGDRQILNQPDQWPLVAYYGLPNVPVTYVPAGRQVVSPAVIRETLEPLVSASERIWLGPIGAWTRDPESLVEQYLAQRMFQADKTWFAGSGSAGLYLAETPLNRVSIPSVSWDGGIWLLRFDASELAVVPGDAYRLQFTWLNDRPVEARLHLLLRLIDDAGQVWASRKSEPCAGWCPTHEWAPARRKVDRHALLVPPGTPPGDYRLQLAWTDPDTDQPLPATIEGERSDWLDLAAVRVVQATAPGTPVPGAILRQSQDLGQAVFGQVALLAWDLLSAEVTVGSGLALDLHWQALSVPVDDLRLSVVLVNQAGRPAAEWRLPLVADTHPTSAWAAGEYLHRQHLLPLPPRLEPGRYRLYMRAKDSAGRAVALGGEEVHRIWRLLAWRTARQGSWLDLGRIDVVDRRRSFNRPAFSQPVEAQLGEVVDLLGFDLPTTVVDSGSVATLTLVWQAGAATDAPYKVFAHLTAADDGVPLAQHDGWPGGGCCPSDTWVEGEVIVDRHDILVGSNLAPGEYALKVGMYREGRPDDRLPAYNADGLPWADDAVLLTRIQVQTPAMQPTPVPLYRSDWAEAVVFLPLVLVGEP